MSSLTTEVSRLISDMYNHGNDGLKTTFTKFIADHAATERERDRQHKANQTRLNLIIAILSLLCTILTTVILVKGLHKASELLNPFHSLSPSTSLATDAETSPMHW